jgi:hypothetical protein
MRGKEGEHTNLPKLNGPGLNEFCPKNLAEMGIKYATYCPQTASEKMATEAAGPARVSKPNIQATIPAKMTPLTGVWVYELMR